MSMDICSLSATDNINDIHGLCMNPPESTHGVLKVLSVDELSVDVTKYLNIQDAKENSKFSPTPHSFQEKDACSKFHENKNTTQVLEKCLSKSATFPSSDKTASSKDAIAESSTQGDNARSLDPSGFRSTSMPVSITHLKPVSAMKGSREKRGAAPAVKLTVKWAPDVYDPIPTSVSHVTTNNKSSRHSKKNSRNKQKSGSKSSRGSKGKDKKQVRKRGGNSSGMGYMLPEYEEEMVDFHEHEPKPKPKPKSGGIDFHVGNPDRLCGSSFLKGYGTSLHLSSVTEAT